MAKAPIELGDAVVFVPDAGMGRSALVQGIHTGLPEGADQPMIDCVTVNDQGAVETHQGIGHVADPPAIPYHGSWRRPTDHPMPREERHADIGRTRAGDASAR